MFTIILILLLLGFIEQTASIQCYACVESGFYCSLPFNLDAGDESNENNVATFGYDAGFACMSDQKLNPRTGEQTLVLRGVQNCEEVNIPNHRVYCCYTNHCNKYLPAMIIQNAPRSVLNVVRTTSTGQHHLSSIILTVFSSFFINFFKQIKC